MKSQATQNNLLLIQMFLSWRITDFLWKNFWKVNSAKLKKKHIFNKLMKVKNHLECIWINHKAKKCKTHFKKQKLCLLFDFDDIWKVRNKINKWNKSNKSFFPISFIFSKFYIIFIIFISSGLNWYCWLIRFFQTLHISIVLT